MSRVSHFQRFSQPENHATNNTLLALRYFYQSSPFKLQRILNSLLEEDLSIGLTFEQQVKGAGSIPDALISQQSLKLYIETKRGGDLDAEQIIRHLASMEHDGIGAGEVLMGLTKEPIDQKARNHLKEVAAKQAVTFAAVTFSQVVEALRAQCAPFDVDLNAVADDYEAYLSEEGLLEERNQWLIVVPCGTSINENARFGLYYEPASRPCKRNHRFLGLYTQKAVAYVGVIFCIAVASFERDGRAEIVAEAGTISESDRTRIMEAVSMTSYYDLKETPHRFYLVEEFVPLNLRKISAGGIMGLRYLDLTKLAPDYDQRSHYSANELAKLLQGRTWE